MINSITRYFKGIWYALIGRAHMQAAKLSENPEAVRGAYEVIIHNKQLNILRYKEMIGQSLALIEQKKNSLRNLTNEIDELEQMRAGAIAKAKSTAAELQEADTSDEEIKQHPDYVLHITSYNDYHSTLEEKHTRSAKLERDIKRAQEDIESYKLELTTLHRDLDKIKSEQSSV